MTSFNSTIKLTHSSGYRGKPKQIKQTKEQNKLVFMLNTAAEKAFQNIKRKEGWTEKRINKSIEKLEHIKMFQAEMLRRQRELTEMKREEEEDQNA